MKRFILIVIFLIWSGYCFSQVAIFPFEDLSKSLNGVNFYLSSLVSQKLKDKGYSVVGPDKVADLLARYRVMWTGWVDRITAERVKRELNCQYAILGTVLSNDPERFAFGFTLRMLDLDRYKLVWSRVVFFSKRDNISILGLRKKSWDDFLKESVDKVLSDIPPEILKSMMKAPVMDVYGVDINRYVKPGEEVECKVRVEVSGLSPHNVFFVVDGIGRIPAKKKGHFYICEWTAPQREGRFGVTLEAFWDGTLNIKKRFFITSYYVDSTPPKFKLKLIGVRKFKGKVVVNKYVEIMPLFKRREVIKRWLFEVVSDDEKKVVFSYSSMGDIPEKLFWRGQTFTGYAPNGNYTLRLVLWDRAGNSYKDEREVLLVRKLDNIEVKAVSLESGLKLSVSVKNYPILFSNWRIVLWDDSGSLFYEKEGEGLPSQIVLPIKHTGKSKLFYSLELIDEAGNHWRFRKERLIFTKAKSRKQQKASGWVNDF